MAINHKRAHVLIGGVAGAVDKIDGAGLSVGDTIQCININGIYDYVNVQDSRAELSPFTIRPDNNPGTNSWHLVGTTARIGALVKLSSDVTLSDAITTPIDWEAETYDDANFWEGVTNPERFTIPIGINKVKLKANIRFNTNGTGFRLAAMLKNGVNFDGKGQTVIQPNSSLITSIPVATAKIDVVGGTDYFELVANQASGGNLDVEADTDCWFSIEAVGFR